MFADYLDRMEELHNNFKAAIQGLSSEGLDWVPAPEANSLCVLVVHTMAAERYWIGDIGIQEPSNRNRDAEFAAKNMTEAQLVQCLDDTLTYTHDALTRITPDMLDIVREAKRSLPGLNNQFTVAWALWHALEHTGLHVGHAQITRQILPKVDTFFTA